MRLGFRKTFKFGPFRTTVSHRGITNSIGAGGLRLSQRTPLSGSGRRRRTAIRDETVAPSSDTAAGNPVLGFVVLGLAAFGLYALFF